MLRSLLCLLGLHEFGRPMAVRAKWVLDIFMRQGVFYVCDRRCRHCGTVKELPYQP